MIYSDLNFFKIELFDPLIIIIIIHKQDIASIIKVYSEVKVINVKVIFTALSISFHSTDYIFAASNGILISGSNPSRESD